MSKARFPIMVGLLALVATTPAVEGTASLECGDFVPLEGPIVDMMLKNHVIYDETALGASATYLGPDGKLTYYSYDLGLDEIAQDVVDQSITMAIRDIRTVITMLEGEVQTITNSEQSYAIGDVVLAGAWVMSSVDDAQQADFVAIGTDGQCLHKVRYTPDMADTGDDGRNSEGLGIEERFHRVMQQLAPYGRDKQAQPIVTSPNGRLASYGTVVTADTGLNLLR